MSSASLIQTGWLTRVLAVQLEDPPAPPRIVRYSGRGIGFETVYVDRTVAARATSWRWFVPRFVFSLAGHEAIVTVRFGLFPFLTIESFALTVDGKSLYSEGPQFASC